MPSYSEPTFFAPLKAWRWKDQVYESDSAGLAMHRSACGVTDIGDSDWDCTCGAHALNEIILEGRGIEHA